MVPTVIVRSEITGWLLTMTRLTSCLSVPLNTCKKRLKNESWPEWWSVPSLPNQGNSSFSISEHHVAASMSLSGMQGDFYIAKVFQDTAPRTWVIEGGGLAEWVWVVSSAMKRWDCRKAHFLCSCTPSSCQSLFLGAHKSSSGLDANQSWV